MTGRAYNALVGYRRPFASLREAQDAIAAYLGEGHETAANVEWHLALGERLRPSDYAALFHLRTMLPGLARVFDLGGSAGNLFYSYRQRLDFPPGLIWQVCDLPRTIARGRQVAQERGAAQLRFTPEWTEASGADLLIASGSLHYFERPLSDMVADLAVRPRAILVNRTPLTDGPPMAAVQDGPGFCVACMLHNRAALIKGFERLGYRLRDEWQAAELHLRMPCYPERSADAYTGFFLTLT